MPIESFFGTCALVLAALLAAFAFGYGPVTLLLPAQHRALRWAAMPATGYLTFCLLVMVISGNLGVAVAMAIWPASAILLAIGVIAYLRERGAAMPPEWSDPELRRAGLLLLPSLFVVIAPVLVQSAELYIGSGNLDFHQSLVYHELLRKHDLSVFAEYVKPVGTHSTEISAKSWPPQQGRFGGVMLSFLLQSLTNASAKSSLTTATVVFAACLPLTFYFFSRVVLGLSVRQATFCGVLTAFSSPLSLSFLFVLVGQGSGLPILPLVIAVLYLALRQVSLRLLAYAALLVTGLFWLYAMMLPFALGPMGLLAAYLLVRRRLPWTWAFAILAGVAAAMFVAWSGMFGQLLDYFKGLAVISGRLVGTLFFVEFLTEMFFAYLLGITSYPATNSFFASSLYRTLGEAGAWRVAVAVTAAALAFYGVALASWYRNQADDTRRKAVAAMGFMYAVVWVYFSFVKPYPYSAFKMTAWLQFMVIPFFAYGIVHFWDNRRLGRFRVMRGLGLCAGVLYAAANLATSIDYGVLSFGTNRERGNIVNGFGIGNNPEFATLGRDVSQVAGRTQSVGILFTDAIQNRWAAYRLLHRMQHSVLSHELLTEDDVALPDPVTGDVVDTSGEKKRVKAAEFADVRNDFYLLPGPDNLNPEITLQALADPVWHDATYQLQARERMQDFLYLGRGFYRNEFPRRNTPWWQPAPSMRWSRDGGEFYILQASRPGEAYRLQFTAMVGFGLPNASRTLEFYHGSKKFDEVRVHDISRIVSAPFYPRGPLDRITVVIKEKAPPMKRRMGLWNMDLPDDTRSLNMKFSSARIIRPGENPGPAAPRRVSGNDILDKAYLLDGISADGWIGRAASFTFISPVDRPTATLDVLVPGNLGFAFPFAVTVVAENVEQRFVVAQPGPASFRVSLPGKKANDPLSFEVRPQSFRESDDAFARRNRPILQSLHVESIEFSPAQ